MAKISKTKISTGVLTGISSSVTGLPNSITTSNSNLTIGNSGVVTWGNGTISPPTNFNGFSYSHSSTLTNIYDFSDKTIDLEKLILLEESKRKILLDLFFKFLDCTDPNTKLLMYNTLQSYKLFIDKKSLERKIKISMI